MSNTLTGCAFIAAAVNTRSGSGSPQEEATRSYDVKSGPASPPAGNARSTCDLQRELSVDCSWGIVQQLPGEYFFQLAIC